MYQYIYIMTVSVKCIYIISNLDLIKTLKANPTITEFECFRKTFGWYGIL